MKKITKPKLSRSNVLALLSSVAALARPRADREVRDTAKQHLSAHLADLRKARPRCFVELASGSAPTNKVPKRDEVDELIAALSVLSRDGSAPDARSAALDRLISYFDKLMGDAPASFETASMSSLNQQIASLNNRIARAEAAASGRLRAMQREAARPVVSPDELAAIGAIERAAAHTLGPQRAKPTPLTAGQRAAIIAAGFDK